MIGVLLGVYLGRLGVGPAEMGFVVGAGLAGAACATVVATLAGDRLGRRRFLASLALLGATGAAVAAAASSAAVIGAAAFVGMLNGMGRDRGAALVLEQAVLPATATDADRTRVFAWYNVLQDAGHALGGLAAAMPALLRGLAVPDLMALRLAVGTCALLTLLPAVLYLGLSPAIDVPRDEAPARLSPESRSVLRKISALFALDALGGGFVTAALLAFFFYQRFGVREGSLGLLFFGARLANALSHLAAAWLARRIGLVNTMVFTHIPSSLLLVTVAFAPSFWVAALLFLVREGLVEMDVAPVLRDGRGPARRAHGGVRRDQPRAPRRVGGRPDAGRGVDAGPLAGDAIRGGGGHEDPVRRPPLPRLPRAPAARGSAQRAGVAGRERNSMIVAVSRPD